MRATHHELILCGKPPKGVMLVLLACHGHSSSFAETVVTVNLPGRQAKNSRGREGGGDAWLLR